MAPFMVIGEYLNGQQFNTAARFADEFEARPYIEECASRRRLGEWMPVKYERAVQAVEGRDLQGKPIWIPPASR